MTRPTRLEMLEAPVPMALDDLESAPLCAFFALGTVNPYGPTLAFTASLGPWASGAQAAVVRAVLSPFAQTVEQVGWLAMGDEWQPQELLGPLLGLELGECPSLLLLNAAIPDSEREAFAFEILTRREGGAAQRLAGVERYFAQPYERVGWEMQGAAAEPEPVMSAEAYAWLARLLLDPRHSYPELGAFLFAWRGSVEEVPMPDAQREQAFHFARFSRFFSDRVCALLALPEKPAAEPPAERAAAQAALRYQPESIAALDALLAGQGWRAMPPDQQHDVLKAALLAYGVGLDPKYLLETGALYSHLMAASGAEAGARLQVLREVNDAMRELPLQPEVFLPFLAFDADRGVVAAATLALLGRPGKAPGDARSGLVELDTLLESAAAANPGAVVGAVEALGEPACAEFLSRWRARLDAEALKEAALTRSLGTPRR